METLAGEILTAWRRAERLAAQFRPGTPEQLAALDACDRLRDLYGDLVRTEGHAGDADIRAALKQVPR